MKDDKIPLARPTLAPWKEVAEQFQEVYESGNLTCGPFTAKLEAEAAKRFQVEHVVALSSCTSGLMLVLRALKVTGEVILPSFTWASSGLAVLWNDLRPIFADCLPGSYTLDPDKVRRLMGKRTGAVMAVNVFGLYPDMDPLREICAKAGVPLICDSAQGAGAQYRGKIGGGHAEAEVFSLAPTKVLTAVEGGLLATDNARLADVVRQMRDYGKTPDGRDVRFVGLSSRMSELHAVVGLSGLERLEEAVKVRKRLVEGYREGLGDIPGLAFQEVPGDRTGSWSYFVVFLGPSLRPRDELMDALARRGVAAKPYFHPPLHRQGAFAACASPPLPLPVSEEASSRALALPLYTHMGQATVDRVCRIFREESGE